MNGEIIEHHDGIAKFRFSGKLEVEFGKDEGSHCYVVDNEQLRELCDNGTWERWDCKSCTLAEIHHLGVQKVGRRDVMINIIGVGNGYIEELELHFYVGLQTKKQTVKVEPVKIEHDVDVDQVKKELKLLEGLL